MEKEEEEEVSEECYSDHEPKYETSLLAVENGVRKLYQQEKVTRLFILFSLKCIVQDLSENGLMLPNDIIFYLMNLCFIGINFFLFQILFLYYYDLYKRLYLLFFRKILTFFRATCV